MYNAGRIVGTDTLTESGKACGINDDNNSLLSWVEPPTPLDSLWCGCWDRFYRKINTTSWTVVDTYDPGSVTNNTYQLVCDTINKYLIATAGGYPRRIVVVDLKTRTHFIREFTSYFDTSDIVLTIDPYTQIVYLLGNSTSWNTGAIVKYDHTTDTILGYNTFYGYPYLGMSYSTYNVTHTQTHIISCSYNTLISINKQTLNIYTTRSFSQSSLFRHTTVPSMGRFYGCHGGNILAEYDVSTLEISRSLTLSNTYFRPTVDIVNKKAYTNPLTSSSSARLQKIDLTTMTLEITNPTVQSYTLGTAHIYDYNRNRWYRSDGYIQDIDPATLNYINRGYSFNVYSFDLYY